jgi:hypothetical protein
MASRTETAKAALKAAVRLRVPLRYRPDLWMTAFAAGM